MFLIINILPHNLPKRVSSPYTSNFSLKNKFWGIIDQLLSKHNLCKRGGLCTACMSDIDMFTEFTISIDRISDALVKLCRIHHTEG